MSRTPKPRKSRRGPGRSLLRMHRRVGIALSAIFIVICLTGILLNHNDDLEFQSRTIESDWLYDWYGLVPKSEIIHYALPSGSLSSLDGELFANSKSLGPFPTPVGAAELESLTAIAFSDSLLLLTHEGEILESLSAQSLPATPIRRISAKDSRTLRIDTKSGTYESDESILEWTASNWSANLPEISQTPPSPALRQEILRSYRGEGITWGRVILDIHTGRFFGKAGKWIADLAALALIFLTLTGVFYTLRYLKKARNPSSENRV